MNEEYLTYIERLIKKKVYYMKNIIAVGVRFQMDVCFGKVM